VELLPFLSFQAENKFGHRQRCNFLFTARNVFIELADSIITCGILIRSLGIYMKKLERESSMTSSERKKVSIEALRLKDNIK